MSKNVNILKDRNTFLGFLIENKTSENEVAVKLLLENVGFENDVQLKNMIDDCIKNDYVRQYDFEHIMITPIGIQAYKSKIKKVFILLKKLVYITIGALISEIIHFLFSA